MQLRRLDALTWTLIYAGLLALCLGIFVTPRHESLGWTLMLGGGGVALFGALLIYVRARLRDDSRERKQG